MMTRNRMTATVLIALLAMATPGFAWMGGWSGYGMGPAVGTTPLTAELQKKVDAVQKKYQPQLDELQGKLNAKPSELAAARANGDTTVSKLNVLETELFQLERRYWTLLDQANAEAAQITGTSYGPNFTCAYMGCNHQHRMGAMPPGGYMACCW